jgi:hypothetical protein
MKLRGVIEIGRRLEDPRLFEAIGTVGRTPEKQFRWLREFVARDVGSYEDGLPDDLPHEVLAKASGEGGSPPDPGVDLEATRWELIAFAQTGWKSHPSRPKMGIDPAILATGPPSSHPTLFESDPSPAVQMIHGEIASALRTLVRDRFLPLRVASDGAEWDREKGLLIPFARIDEAEPTRALSWVNGAVVALLAELAPRLRVCRNPTCALPLFLPEVGQQRFCTKRCSGRLRQAGHRRRHPGKISDQRHSRYAKKKRTELGPRVKVDRRPRRH